jgi:hypothetical protein
MHLVKQVIVTTIGELNQIAQKAHLRFGDNPNTQINILVGHDGVCQVEGVSPISDWGTENINETHKMD